jgi:hypothetical protein
VPDDWDDDWGIGRVDLVNLLQAPLPDLPRVQLDAVRAAGAPSSLDSTADDAAVSRLAATLGTDPVLLRRRLASLLGAATPAELAQLLDDHGGELVWLVMAEPTFADALAAPPGASGPADLLDAGRGPGADGRSLGGADLPVASAGVAGVSSELARRLGQE